jgi:CheY-like chemotaxis protein
MKNKTMPPRPRPRWMIVDDNNERLSLVNDIFTRFNDVLDVHVFNSPEDAVSAFAADPDAFEFVLTDLDMPEVSDLELYRRLRAFSPALKILLSTASEIMSHEEAEQKGFCGPMSKPFPLADLRAALYEPQSAARN